MERVGEVLLCLPTAGLFGVDGSIAIRNPLACHDEHRSLCLGFAQPGSKPAALRM